jgi:hypothetical protein
LSSARDPGNTNTGFWNSGDVNTGFDITADSGQQNSGMGNVGSGISGFNNSATNGGFINGAMSRFEQHSQPGQLGGRFMSGFFNSNSRRSPPGWRASPGKVRRRRP